MNVTERDKKLALFLPAVVIFAGYAWFAFGNLNSRLNQARQEMAAQQNQLPSPDQVFDQHEQAAAAGRALTAARTEGDALRRRWKAAVGCCAEGTQRHVRNERLTSLLARHNLNLIEDTETPSKKDAKIESLFDVLTQPATEFAAGPKPQVRQLRVWGRFADVCQALRELGHGDTLAVPVALVMKDAPLGEEFREWVVFVWM